MTRYDWNKVIGTTIHLTRYVQPLLSGSWHDRRGGWEPSAGAGAGADPPPPLHSKSVETFLFTSDRLLGWAGLGWAEQDTGGQVRCSECCVRGSVAETAVDLKNGKIPHFCRQQIAGPGPGPGAACRDADLNGISPA